MGNTEAACRNVYFWAIHWGDEMDGALPQLVKNYDTSESSVYDEDTRRKQN